jgi:hypothetical protein
LNADLNVLEGASEDRRPDRPRDRTEQLNNRRLTVSELQLLRPPWNN